MSDLKMNYKTMNVKVDGSIATVSYCRPAYYNASNAQMRRDRVDIFTQISADRNIKVVILTGNEKAFCAGGDLKEFSTCTVEQAQEISEEGYAFQNLIINLPQPVIAAVSGYAYGGGMESVLMCDLCIASENATFALPEINVGFMPGNGGTQRLVQSISICKAKELIFFGAQMDAKEALRLGFINLVVPQEALLDTAREWAERLCQKPAIALQQAKRCINQAWGRDIDTGMRMESQAWVSLFGTEDQKEGAKAFLEKRKPLFVGR